MDGASLDGAIKAPYSDWVFAQAMIIFPDPDSCIFPGLISWLLSNGCSWHSPDTVALWDIWVHSAALRGGEAREPGKRTVVKSEMGLLAPMLLLYNLRQTLEEQSLHFITGEMGRYPLCRLDPSAVCAATLAESVPF